MWYNYSRESYREYSRVVPLDVWWSTEVIEEDLNQNIWKTLSKLVFDTLNMCDRLYE